MKTVFLFIGILFSCAGIGQVNLQNGSGYYQIPIFSFADGKSGLSSDVSLNYSSGNGLLVSQKASNVGQGWALNAGGVISRKQVGEPDDQNSTSTFPIMPSNNYRGYNMNIAYYDEDLRSIDYPGDCYSRDYIDNYYPNGFMYSEFLVDMEDEDVNFQLSWHAPREQILMPRFKSSMDKRYKQSRRSLADREQDIFTFNFGGMYGEFVIGKDGNVQLLNDSKLKIQYNTENLTGQNIRTRIKEFIIRDEIGTEYKFSAYDLSEVLIPDEVASYGIPSFTYKIMAGTATGKYIISQWHLTEITNPVTMEKIVFNYEMYEVNETVSQTPLYQNTVGESAETVQMMVNITKGKLKRVSNIVFPDGHKLEFNYNRGFGRPDFIDDDPLWKILLTYNNEEKYTYTFGQGYFHRKEVKDITTIAPVADKRFTRYCLKSLQKSYNGVPEPAYNFTYYTGSESSDPKDIVPPFDCLAEDHWGYYTKNTNLDIEAALTKESIKELLLNAATYRLPTNGLAALGLLKSVETPTGGKFTFEYAQNYSKNADNPSQSLMFGGVSVSKTILSDGVSSDNDIITNYYYKNTDGTTSGWGYENNEYSSSRTIKVWNNGNIEGYTNDGRNKTNISSIVNRISSFISQSSKVGMFSAAAKEGVKKSILPPLPAAQALLFKLILEGFMKRVFVLFNPSDTYTTNIYHFNSQQYRNPIGVNYSRTEVVNNSIAGGTGKTVYEFTAPTNVRTEIPALAMPFSDKKRFQPWKYGLPLKTKIYNQSGTLLSEATNQYNIVETEINNVNHKSCKVEVHKYHSAACFNSNAHDPNAPIQDMTWQHYFPVRGRAELISTLTTNYSPTGLQSQAITSFEYNADYLPKKVTTPKSNGDLLVQKTYYANDYNNSVSTAIAEMKLRNMVGIPVSTETWLVKPNAAELLVDATVNEFFINTNNEIRLYKSYKLEAKEPLLKYLIGEQSPTALIRNATYFKEKAAYKYDDQGNLRETFTPDGRFNTQIYNYNGRFVVASVSNTHEHEEADYTSFETTEHGHWSFGGATIAAAADAVMGKKVLRMAQKDVDYMTNYWRSERVSRLSFWKKGNAAAVLLTNTPLTPIKTIPNTAPGWTYYEYKIPAGSGGTQILTITKALNDGDFVYFDELRIYPKDAKMVTIAYDPKIGNKTSECDFNNRILYYEYDKFNRLIHIKDEQKNILKKICYNIAGEPENCIDAQDTSPQWRDDGTTMCEACQANPAYNSGVRLKRQVDRNPLSSTYNQFQWVVDNSGTCPVAPDWYQRTDIANCEVNGYGVPTGNYIIPTVDINPCSPTYNQWGTPVIIPNHPACIPCNPACNAPEYKCINGTCVQGTWGIVKVRRIDKFTWQCTSAYCFPDGTISDYTQSVITTTACTAICP